MPPIFLHVPFEEKDEAKKLGARWDATARRWYVPDGLSSATFKRWSEPRPEVAPERPSESSIALNLLLARPAIVDAIIQCWSCKAETPVTTLAAKDSDGEWEGVRYVQGVDPVLTAYLTARTHFRMAYSRTTRQWSYKNRCVCGALQGDFFLHSEPDGPFFSLSESDSSLRWTLLVAPARIAADFDPVGDIS